MHEILSLGIRAENAKKLLLSLYGKPIVTVKEAAQLLNDLLHWLQFFLTAIEETAVNSKKFVGIMQLREDVEHEILSLGIRAENAKKLLLSLYGKPIVTVKEAAQLLNVSHQVANELIKLLKNKNILEETTGYRRNRVYCFDRYLQLFNP